MPLKKAHGNLAKTGHAPLTMEVLPPSRLPDLLPTEPDPVQRRSDGTLVDSASAKALGARGGAGKAAKRRFLTELAFEPPPKDSPLAIYYRAAEAFIATLHAQYLEYGGGYIGAGITAQLHNAGCAYFVSKYYFNVWMKTLDRQDAAEFRKFAELFTKLSTYSLEYVIKEAKARGTNNDPSGLRASFADAIEAHAITSQYAETDVVEDLTGDASEDQDPS